MIVIIAREEKNLILFEQDKKKQLNYGSNRL